MNIAVLTLFPEMFQALSGCGVIGRALRGESVTLRAFNPRDYTEDRHRTVDDRPYGGGPGMVMMVEPLERALVAARQWIEERSGGGSGPGVLPGQDATAAAVRSGPRVICTSPQGRRLEQQVVRDLASAGDMILVAGRYEGIDERFIARHVDDELSIGDYVLSGGELPAMVIVDAVVRLLPGVLGHAESAASDSFGESGLLDHPHYTRPESYRGDRVPEVLLSGDHQKIAQWRASQALERTRLRRPDLLDE